MTADEVPDEEAIEPADVAGNVDTDPEDQVSRPEQADFDPAEREQYQNPPVETSLADADVPEDR